jgi:hypothetical protein
MQATASCHPTVITTLSTMLEACGVPRPYDGKPFRKWAARKLAEAPPRTVGDVLNELSNYPAQIRFAMGVSRMLLTSEGLVLLLEDIRMNHVHLDDEAQWWAQYDARDEAFRAWRSAHDRMPLAIIAEEQP